jgi:hypothetical protein
MRHRTSPKRRILGRNLPGAWALALAVALTLSLAQSAWAQVSPPDVPADIELTEDAEAYLVGHAVGTQNYICLPSGSKIAWSLFTPQATLFDDEGQQLTTHFFSPNPDENGTVRPAWQHSQDTSTVWVRLSAASTDAEFVAPGAIPWLLLEAAGSETGPDDGDTLTYTTWIHRVNTTGGLAPSTGCSKAKDVGTKAFVPYTADYFFYLDPGIE